MGLLDLTPETAEVVRDDLLRLVFTCCHPALALEAQVALALRTLGGLSTAEVARGLLVPEATMAKRLTRAKQKIAQARIPYRVPAAEELPDRLAGVAATIYLIFNEGYAAGAGADLVRAGLTDEAIRLARLLAELMPDEPTVLGLLALLLLHGRPAGRPGRRRRRAGAAGRPGPRPVGPPRDPGGDGAGRHGRCGAPRTGPTRTWCRPRSRRATRWPAATRGPTGTRSSPGTTCCSRWRTRPVVRLNRAAAVAERDGPAAGLALVEAIDGLAGYPWWHATRAELLHRLGQPAAARAAYRRALRWA